MEFNHLGIEAIPISLSLSLSLSLCSFLPLTLSLNNNYAVHYPPPNCHICREIVCIYVCPVV